MEQRIFWTLKKMLSTFNTNFKYQTSPTLSCCFRGETYREIGGQELPEVHELTQYKFLQETHLFQDMYFYMKQCSGRCIKLVFMV